MQGDLFSTGALAFNNGPDLPLQQEQLLAWQQRLHAHQAPLFRGERASTAQGDLFGASPDDAAAAIDPLALTCLLYTSPSPRDRQKSRMPSSA